jgi:hypothetical protein
VPLSSRIGRFFPRHRRHDHQSIMQLLKPSIEVQQKVLPFRTLAIRLAA